MEGGFLSGGDGALDVLVRAARIMADEVQRDDLQGAEQWNAAISAIERAKARVADPEAKRILQEALDEIGKRHVPVRVYAPAEDLLEDELVFGEADMARMFEQGVSDAGAPAHAF
jgi:hypothetical protein